MLLALVAGSIGVTAAGPSPATSAAPAVSAVPGSAGAPLLDDPTATGTELVQHYTDLVAAGDVDALEAFLAPGFQIVRANGDHYERDEYLALGLPTILEATIEGVVGTQSGDTLTVFWLVTSTQVVDGVEQPVGPAPRLSTFAWVDGEWQLAAHANFGTSNR
jgi:hypothetical protein